MSKRFLLASVLGLLVACGEEPARDLGGGNGPDGAGNDGTGSSQPESKKGDNPATQSGLPCEVDAVLKTRCQTCHAAEPKFGASAPLVTFDDLQKTFGTKKVYELVASRVKDEARPMPPSPNARLADKELAAIEGWIAAGAKASDATCKNDPAPAGVKPLSCKPDTVLKATKPFTMQPGSATDQYVCFGVEMNLTKKRHVIGLAPKVDNAKIVHHILLFQAPQAEKSEPFACEAFGSASWKLVAGWAPGGNNLELPKEAGFPAKVGQNHWVLQIHYNNTQAQTGSDQSGYELCTTEELRPNDAGVLAFGSTSFSIPPRSNHKIRCDYKLDNRFSNVKLFNASPHMHTRGAAMSTERIPGGNGTSEMIFEQKNFSFEAQANFPIQKAVTNGDVMRTRCSWKNPSDQTIKFGEGTDDEMCFDFIGYYPNIPDQVAFGIPLFSWVTPSYNANCSVE